jgi:hypothetical protein
VHKQQRLSSILALAALVLTLDWATGPYIRFPIAFVLPVFLMGWWYGRWSAIGLAYVLLTIRLSYSFYWDAAIPHWLLYEGINTLIRASVLTLVAYLAARVAVQTRDFRPAPKALKGMLPICAHCKKIRNLQNKWEQLEVYITQQSEAEFSHSICPDCMDVHYGDMRRRREQKGQG